MEYNNYLINDHTFVDLGLSVKWASANIGADTPSAYGRTFTWGETNKRGVPESEKKRVLNDLLKENIAGNPNFDMAQACWKGTWRLPTKEEFEELIEKCECNWLDNMKGMLFIGPNKNKLFFPAAGSAVNYVSIQQGTSGFYWTASPDTEAGCSYAFNFFDKPLLTPFTRVNQFYVRPVSF